MMSSFTLAPADVVKASAQPDYRPAGIDVREADRWSPSLPRGQASRHVRRTRPTLGAAIVLNVTLGRELLPMWPAKSRPKT
jgi:hypothetical protein